jgi:hypothetical protein
MATIVNTPTHEHVGEESSGGPINLLVSMLVILAVAFLLFYFGLPLLRNIGGGAPTQINNVAPPQGANAPQINIPDKINVDVNAPKPQQ